MTPRTPDVRERQEVLDRLLAQLEREHEQEESVEMRLVTAQLVDAVEVYLLTQAAQRRGC